MKDVQAKYDLKYREKIVQEAVTTIRTKQDRNKRGSIVQLCGNIGVGKSTILSNAVHFMLQRKYFTGFIVLDLKTIEDFSVFRKQFELTLINILNLRSKPEKRQAIEMASNDEFCRILISFFN